MQGLWLLQGFRSAEEVQRFSDMMDEMCYIVATKHSGSLKVQRTSMLGCLTGLINMPAEVVFECIWRGFFLEGFAVATDEQKHECWASRAQAAAHCI